MYLTFYIPAVAGSGLLDWTRVDTRTLPRLSALLKGRVSEPAESGAAFRLLKRPGLGLKLLLIVVGVSLTGVLASSFLVLTLQRQELIDAAQAESAHLSRAVEASLEHAMLNNDWAVIDRMIQSVATGAGFERVRILDARGVARASSAPEEVGTPIDRSQPACQPCHAAADRPDTLTTVTTMDGQEALLNVTPIRNQASCQACHGSEANILGYLLTETPLTGLRQQLQAGFWRIVLVGAATLALLVGLMLLALRRYVTRPVGALAGGLAAIGAGDLDCEVQVASGDELGDLAAAFDAMRRQLKASRVETEGRNRELSLLNEIALAAGQLLEVQAALELALDIVVDKLGMEAGSVYLYDEQTGRLECRAHRGLTQAQRREVDRRRLAAADWVSPAAQAGQVLFFPQVDADERLRGLWDDGERRSGVYLPLRSRGAVVGAMGLATRAGEPLAERNLLVLEAVGHEIGIAIDNAMLLAETRRGEREAMALYELGMRISASLEPEQVLDTVAAGAQGVLGAEAGLVALLDESSGELEVRAAAGAWSEALRGRRLAPSGGELRPADLVAGLGEALCGEAGEGAVSWLAVPMERAGKLRGLVSVASRLPRRFTAADERLLSRLAQEVVAAIENAQLYQRVRRLAVLEERERLAREMHDNLAQSLGFLNLKASVTDWLLESKQLDEARNSLREVKEVSMAAYRDVREAIFSLRTAASPDVGFVPALRDYLDEYRTHYGVDAELQLEVEWPASLPADVGVQITRIIQEALTNVRKHAATGRARVRIARGMDALEITIEDDGRGFDLDRVAAEGRQCFGLQVMRERAASVGAGLALESRPGEGTRVRVRVPVPVVSGT